MSTALTKLPIEKVKVISLRMHNPGNLKMITKEGVEIYHGSFKTKEQVRQEQEEAIRDWLASRGILFIRIFF